MDHSFVRQRLTVWLYVSQFSVFVNSLALRLTVQCIHCREDTAAYKVQSFHGTRKFVIISQKTTNRPNYDPWNYIFPRLSLYHLATNTDYSKAILFTLGSEAKSM